MYRRALKMQRSCWGLLEVPNLFGTPNSTPKRPQESWTLHKSTLKASGTSVARKLDRLGTSGRNHDEEGFRV